MRRRLRGCLSYILVTLVTTGTLVAVMPLIYAYVLARTDYVTHHQFFYEILSPDPVYGYVIRPHLRSDFVWSGVTESYDTDERGFNNPGYNPDAPIAVIGDSYTASNYVPFESRWPHLLAQATGLAVYNYGVNGYAPWQYAQVIAHQVLEANHQLLLVSFYINDFGAGVTYHPESGEDYYALAGWQTYESPYRFTLSRLNWMVDRIRPSLTPPSDTSHPVSGSEVLSYTLSQADVMITAAEAQHLPIVFTLIPSGANVEQGRPSEEERLYYYDFCSYIESKNHLCYDMTADFTAAYQDSGQPLYNVGEHWNEGGNQLAAQLIDDYLRENNLLDGLQT